MQMISICSKTMIQIMLLKKKVKSLIRNEIQMGVAQFPDVPCLLGTILHMLYTLLVRR